MLNRKSGPAHFISDTLSCALSIFVYDALRTATQSDTHDAPIGAAFYPSMAMMQQAFQSQ